MKKTINTSKRRMILRVVSVFAAIIVWLLITNSENPLIDYTINAIDVQLVGETELYEKGLMVVEKQSIPKASIVARGKRRDLMAVMDTITAGVDLSAIEYEGIYNIKPVFDIPSSSVYISKRNTMNIQVEVQPIHQKKISVEVVYKNEDKNKDFIVETIPKTPEITIEGASGDIEKIDHASIYVDVSEMIDTHDASYSITLEDVNNSEVSLINDVKTQSMYVGVTNNVYKKVILPIDIQLPDGINDKYTAEILTSSAQEVAVGLLSDNYDENIVAVIESNEIIPGTNTYNFRLIEPDGIYIPEGKKTINVKLELFKKKEKTINIPITFKNEKQRKFNSSQQSVALRISGPEEKLVAENLVANVDIDSIYDLSQERQIRVDIKVKEADITVMDGEIYINISAAD